MSRRGAEPRKRSRNPAPVDRPSPFRRQAILDFARGRTAGLALAAYGALLACFSMAWLRSSLARSWFFSSDEYVFAAEVIRFLRLNFHQSFFDMPGTPYMMLTALLWGGFSKIAGWLVPGEPTGMIVFTFRHIDWLFFLLRAETLVFYALSLVLVVLLARKVLNPAGACIAGLVLAMSPIYAKYSSFSRVESLAICLMLAALLMVYRGLETAPERLGEPPSWCDRMIAAGLLCGIAAGARLHSIAASGAVLFFLLLLDTRLQRRDLYPAWILRASWVVLPLASAAGVFSFWMVRRQVLPEYPYAASLLFKASGALTVAPAAMYVLYRISGTRRLLVRAVSPEAIKLLMGGIVGFLISTPTIIPQFDNFLRSMNFYSGSYIDMARTTWALWKNIRWYVSFYGNVFAPDKILLLLAVAGASWIAISRHRRLAPYLITVLTFFVSKPINLTAAPHHTLLWLPFFAILCAYPVARLYEMACGGDAADTKRVRLAAAAATAGYVVVALLLTNGPSKAAFDVRLAQARLDNVGKATGWLHDRTPLNSTLAFGYFCFNSDTFYEYLQAMGVSTEGAQMDPRHHLIWWGRRGPLTGLAGYLCTTAGIGTEQQHDNLDHQDPNHIVDPYKERDFERVASFGNDFDEVDVFRFDFRNAGSGPK